MKKKNRNTNLIYKSFYSLEDIYVYLTCVYVWNSSNNVIFLCCLGKLFLLLRHFPFRFDNECMNCRLKLLPVRDLHGNWWINLSIKERGRRLSANVASKMRKALDTFYKQEIF